MGKYKRLASLLLSLLLMVSLIASASPVWASAAPQKNITLISKVLEYGQNVVALALDLGAGNEVAASALSNENFAVKATNYLAGTARFDGPRAVTGVYPSGVIDVGAPAASGRYVIVELSHAFDASSPTNNGASVMITSGRAKELDLNYFVNVTADVKDALGSVLLSSAETYIMKDAKCIKNLIVDDFKDGLTAEGLHYKLYSPDVSEGEKAALVVWTHGGGEGSYTEDGTEIFTGAQIRANMGGTGWVEFQLKNPSQKAFVAAPQADNHSAGGNGGWDWNNEKGKAVDAARVDKMISAIIAANPGKIDTNRIYISGCSNGGAQALAQLIYSKETSGANQYAGAVVNCPSLSYDRPDRPEYIKMSDADIQKIKDIPMWFYQSKADPTVKDPSTPNTVKALREAGAPNLRFTHTEITTGIDDSVVYNGHWIWTRSLSNIPERQYQNDRPINWLFRQTLGTKFDLVTQVLYYGQDVTNVVIDAGKAVELSKLSADMFDVKALNTQVGGAVAFDGARKVTGVHVNNTGAAGDTAESGRFIVLDLEHGVDVAGATTFYNSSRNYYLNLNYTVSLAKDLAYADGSVTPAGGFAPSQRGIKNLIVDDFELITEEGIDMFLYSPPEAADAGALPLVLWNHGGGETYVNDTNLGVNLIANMGATGWVQNAGEPCYVLSPQRLGATYDRAVVVAMIQEMIDAGKVDKNRIYVTGASAGGGETWHLMLNYPSFFAGAIICPAGNSSSPMDILADPEKSGVLKDIPIWMVNAGVDSLPATELAYNTLSSIGANIYWTRIPAGQVGYPNDHFVWIPVMNNFADPAPNGRGPIMDWLFSQTKGPSFKLNVDVLEWGSAVTSVIVDMKENVSADDIAADTFSVAAVTKNPVNGSLVYDGGRTVTKAYVSAADRTGTPAESGRYVVLELKYGYNATLAEIDGSAAIVYQSRNFWLNMDYTVTQNKAIGGIQPVRFAYGGTVRPIYDDFELVTNTIEGYEGQKYRLYSPDGDTDRALPLVIFNHGSGETYRLDAASGASNEGSQLFANMGGVGWVKNAPEDCYVLVPQRSFEDYSRAGVIAFVKDLIAQGKVDGSRVYVSGASAGGRETLSFLSEFPDVFAAGIPICPAGGATTTDAQLEAMKAVPLWFIHSEEDRSVLPVNSLTPYQKLLALGADVRRTSFPYVFGTEVPNPEYVDGEGVPHIKYPDGHWSWVMVLNNVFVENGGIPDSTIGLKLMDWLFAQKKASATFDIVAEVKDYGQAVTAVIVHSPEAAQAADVALDTFSVSAKTVMPTNGATVYEGPRTVTKAYVSATNETGKPAESGNYIVLELAWGFNNTAPQIDGSAAINYISRNYQLILDYAVKQEKPIGGKTLDSITQKDIKQPIYEDFDKIVYEDMFLRLYSPKGAEGALPLVLWNHGSGETYASNAETGVNNEGSQLFANFGGLGWVLNAPEACYILAPQRGQAAYTRDKVVAFITGLINEGKVDASRIYVAGCSAGGSETWNYLLSSYRDFFAAAVPCPGGNTGNAERLSAVVDFPLWMVQTGADTLTSTQAAYNTLKAMGSNVRWSSFPVGYNGYPNDHWSWVPTLNNFYSEEYGTTIMGWIFAQKKADLPKVTLSTGVSKLVAGYSANIPVTASFDGTSTVKLGLFRDGALVKISDGVSLGGTVQFRLTPAEALVGTFTVKAIGATADSAGVSFICVAQPESLWAPSAVYAEGKVTVSFASEVSFNEAKKNVTIGGVSVDKSLVSAGGKDIIISAPAVSGAQIVISGVKYADLFPSYTFAFTVIVK